MDYCEHFDRKCAVTILNRFVADVLVDCEECPDCGGRWATYRETGTKVLAVECLECGAGWAE